MSTPIAQNTLDLQALLELANSLPNAGGGSADPVLQPLTVTPSESEQNFIPSSGYDGYSSVKVNAINKTFVGTGVTRQAAQTITPGTSNKTIASGRYLTGAQTILGDADLVAGNIKKGVTIFDVLGTYEGSGGGLPSGISKLATGSFTPTSDQSTSQTIDYNLGVIPDIFALWADTGDTDIPAGHVGYFLSALYFSSKYTAPDGKVYNCLNLVASATSTSVPALRGQVNAGSNNIMVVPIVCSFKGGITHKWIACVFE